MDRIQFAVGFSRDATGTILENAESAAKTLGKAQPLFPEKPTRLYRDVPLPSQSPLDR